MTQGHNDSHPIVAIPESKAGYTGYRNASRPKAPNRRRVTNTSMRLPRMGSTRLNRRAGPESWVQGLLGGVYPQP